LRRTLGITLLLLIAAPSQLPAAGSSSAAPTDRRSPIDSAAAAHQRSLWEQGETIDYSLTWLRIVGGSARMVLEPMGGETIRISSLAESSPFFSRIYRVRDYVESTIDLDGFSTLRFYKNLQEKNRHKEETTVVDASRGMATRGDQEIAVTPPVRDPLSLIYHLRTLDLTPGRKHHFEVLADSTVYSLETEVLRRETISSGLGRTACVVVEPKIRKGSSAQGEGGTRLLIWFTDDSRRIPVRIRTILSAGSITASLRSYAIGPPADEIASGR
jgi:hypothetical protein